MSDRTPHVATPPAWIVEQGERVPGPFEAVPRYLWDLVLAGEITMLELRVAAIIGRFTRRQQDGTVCTFTTNARIADELGSQRDSVKRAAASLIRAGIIIDLDDGRQGARRRRYLVAEPQTGSAGAPSTDATGDIGAPSTEPTGSTRAPGEQADWERGRPKGGCAGAPGVGALAHPSSSNRSGLSETGLLKSSSSAQTAYPKSQPEVDQDAVHRAIEILNEQIDPTTGRRIWRPYTNQVRKLADLWVLHNHRDPEDLPALIAYGASKATGNVGAYIARIIEAGDWDAEHAENEQRRKNRPAMSSAAAAAAGLGGSAS